MRLCCSRFSFFFFKQMTAYELRISDWSSDVCSSDLLLSDIEPNRDVGLATHHYFPVGDVAALAERLRCPASDYAIEGDAILSTFDWDHISERTLAVYREVGA